MRGGGLVGRLLQWSIRGRSSSWLTSALLHFAVILALSWISFGHVGSGPTKWLLGNPEDVSIADLADLESDPLMVTSGGSSSWNTPEMGEGLETARISANLTITPPQMTPLDRPEEISEIPMAETISQPLLSRGGGLDGRTLGNRLDRALRGGGSKASESAVERGLAWLAAHQWEDGGWRFDLEATHPCSIFEFRLL